jgi:hypothetical protein
MTGDEYWTEIESLAREITREAREYRRDLYDVLHETIDGHQWVTYTRFHASVLAHSDHDSAMWDEGLADGIQSHDECMMRAAFCAMVADVQSHDDYDVNQEKDDDDDAA